ncbi:MAG: PPOX class F420-dependent oxidoreductase [Polyangiales bacterium]
MTPDVSAFANSICINLRSFRKDGTPVDTPLWVVVHGNRLASYTDDRTFKAKRVQRNPNVEVAACDVVGRCTTPWYSARARVVREPADRQHIFDRIRSKYGIHWYLSLWGSLLTGRVKHRLVLEFEPLAEVAPPLIAAAPAVANSGATAHPSST